MRSQERDATPHQLMLLLAASLVLFTAFLLRTENLREFPPGVSADEAANVIDAAHIARSWNFPMYEEGPPERSEPLYRLLLALGTAAYGSDVWTMRYTSALMSLFGIAAAYWVATEALFRQPRSIRSTAALLGMIALTVALTHITLSRALYRGTPQVPFTLLAIGFALRGLRLNSRRDFVFAGAALAGALYSYTAAYVVPAAFVILGIQQMILRRPVKRWLPGLLVVAGVAALLWSPVIVRILTTPEAVFTRAADVSQGIDWGRNMRGMIDQFYRLGDENPQYNVALAPIVPAAFLPLFALGLIALIFWFRLPAAALIGSLLLLSTIPAIATEEVSHGLRIIGEFAVLPLIVALGAALLLRILWRIATLRRFVRPGTIAAALVLLIFTGGQARQTYAEYWLYPENWQPWRIFNQVLNHNEWFFRTDHKALAEWIEAQPEALLIPKDALNSLTLRAWLVDSFSQVNSQRVSELAAGTKIVFPWSLERNDADRDALHYVLLHDGEITLLPPLDPASIDAFAEIFATEQPLFGPDERIIGYTKRLDESLLLDFASPRPLDHVFGGEEMRLQAWYGPDTLANDAPQQIEVTLEWQALRRLGHIYWTFVQVQDQNFTRIAGTDQEILKWLAPTTIWDDVSSAYDTHRMELPVLEPGAYALVAGVYPPFGRALAVPRSVNGQALLSWLKVPQTESVSIPANALRFSTQFERTFGLLAAQAQQISENDWGVTLYWQALVDRPGLDATIFLHLVDQDGNIISQDDARPWRGHYPTFIWDVGEIVATEHLLKVDNDTSNLRVRVGMYTFPGPTNLATGREGEEAFFIWLGALDEIRAGAP